MKACRLSKVKRIVVTSSVAAIAYCDPVDMPDNDTFTEENWSDPTSESGGRAYTKSKILAEKAAWDFIKELPDDEKFELATICPSFIVGPAICAKGFESERIISDVINGKHPGMPRVKMGMVDVREVADAHVKAIEVESAANQRFMLTGT